MVEGVEGVEGLCIDALVVEGACPARRGLHSERGPALREACLLVQQLPQRGGQGQYVTAPHLHPLSRHGQGHYVSHKAGKHSAPYVICYIIIGVVSVYMEHNCVYYCDT
jgi:hypothetical protein